MKYGRIKAERVSARKADVSKRKWRLLVLVSLIPAILEIVLFRIGAWFWLCVFPIVLVVMPIVNYHLFKTTIELLIAQAVMGGGLLLSGGISTWLYYSLISRDQMTILVGLLFTFFGVWIEVAVSCCVLPIRGAREAKSKSHDTE